MSPTLSASIELLGYSQSHLVVLNHALALLMFLVLNAFLFKSAVTWRHGAALAMTPGAMWLVHTD
jgi:hypothetical protein